MSTNLENLALSVLTASNPMPYQRDRIQNERSELRQPATPTVTDEIRTLRAENARLKQENCRRRLKMEDMQREIDSLKATITRMLEDY